MSDQFHYNCGVDVFLCNHTCISKCQNTEKYSFKYCSTRIIQKIVLLRSCKKPALLLTDFHQTNTFYKNTNFQYVAKPNKGYNFNLNFRKQWGANPAIVDRLHAQFQGQMTLKLFTKVSKKKLNQPLKMGCQHLVGHITTSVGLFYLYHGLGVNHVADLGVVGGVHTSKRSRSKATSYVTNSTASLAFSRQSLYCIWPKGYGVFGLF